jgi:molybdopterin converting factor small subunit
MRSPPLIQVRVSGVSALREIIGKDTVVTLNNGSTVGDLIMKLEENFGSAYRELIGERLEVSLRKRFNMLYNGEVISPEQNLDKTLSDDDEIVFFQLAGA